MSIGKDVLKVRQPEVSLEFPLTDSSIKQTVYGFLVKSDKPLCVREIARALSLNWSAVKQALVELALTNQRVEYWRCGRTLLFRIKTVAKEV